MARLTHECGRPLFIDPAIVTAVRPHGTEPEEKSIIEARYCPAMLVRGNTEQVNAELRIASKASIAAGAGIEEEKDDGDAT